MNIYKVLVFDGHQSRWVIVEAQDMVSAICSAGSYNQCIKAELVGSSQEVDLTQSCT